MTTPRYGHVPERNLGSYRYWAGLAREADRLGDTMSGLGEYALANAAWRMQAILKERAQTFRVVLDPEAPKEEQPTKAWIRPPEDDPSS